MGLQGSWKRLLGLFIVMMVLGSGCEPLPAQYSVLGNEEYPVSGDVNSANSNSCLAVTASVVGFSDTALEFSGNATIGGSVVLLGRSTLHLSGNARVSEQVYTHSADSVSTSGNASVGTIVTQDFTAHESAVMEFIQRLDQMVPTQSFGGIKDSLVVKGNGGLNVIQVKGGINLSGNKNLVLSGGSKDQFIFLVAGKVSTSGNAAIQVKGTVLPRNILFVLSRAGNGFSLSGNGSLVGTFVAPYGTGSLSGNGKVEGSFFANGQIKITGNGLSLNPAPFCPPLPSPTPTPSPTESPDPTPTPTPSPTESPDPTPTPSPTESPEPTPTPTPSPTESPDPTPTPSPTESPDPTPTPTPSPTESPDPTPTPSPTESPDPVCTDFNCSGGALGV